MEKETIEALKNAIYILIILILMFKVIDLWISRAEWKELSNDCSDDYKILLEEYSKLADDYIKLSGIKKEIRELSL